MRESLFIKAAFSENTEKRPPVWMMRQAGRFMKEYWAVKKKYSFLEMCRTPEIAAKVTMLPIDLLGVDAAIIFSDILLLPQAMGAELHFEQGSGPKFSKTYRDTKDIKSLKIKPAEESMGYAAEAVKLVKEKLKPYNTPLIGFAGAPFTVMSYMAEGSSSRDFKHTKLLLYNNPDHAHKFLEMLTAMTTDYLNMQIKAGVDAVQIFDSWAGTLSMRDYKEFSHNYIKKIIDNLDRKDIPIISFSKGSSVFAPLMAESGADVISADWNADLACLKKSLPRNVAVQGNLDPSVLYASKDIIKGRVINLLESMRGEKGFIFNLGHGIMPDIPFENVKYAIDLIKNFKYY